METARQTASAKIDVFYPIFPTADWIKRLVPLGIRTVQLRVKDDTRQAIKAQISECIAVCNRHSCQLIVNDYWQDAIDLGAEWVHVGQEDLETTDLDALRNAGIKYGISTHSHEELDIALAAKPNYVALGPVYETKLKAMKWAPQGLDKVTDWKARIGDLPLVGIAGITPDRAPGVLAAGADSVAVLTDIVTHDDPESRIKLWLNWAASVRAT